MSQNIPPGVLANWLSLQQTFKDDHHTLVICTDKEGRTFNVVCSLRVNPKTDEWTYYPFAMLIGKNLNPLLTSLDPPPNLKGKWHWPPETFRPVWPPPETD